MELQGASVIVTGGAGGIGEATLRAFAAEGCRLCVADLGGDRLDATVEALRSEAAEAIGVAVDVTDARQLAAMYQTVTEAFGGVDVVHNNAGILGTVDWPELDPAAIARLVEVNLTSLIVSTRLAIDAMGGRGGVIINTSSKASLHPGPMMAVYATTKAGVTFFTQACASLAQSHGIRVNAVLPAAADTTLLRGGSADGPLLDFLGGRVDPARMVEPSRIAAKVVSLCRDDQAVGSCLVVEGATP